MSHGYNRAHGHYRRVQRPIVPAQWRFLLAGIIALLIATCLLFFGYGSRRENSATGFTLRDVLRFSSTAPERGAASASERLIYPYSIVAGGVHSAQQLRQAVGTDPVAAAHYSLFNLAKARVTKLEHNEYAYVSFRIGDNVYWTSHKLRLLKGESLLTDGDHQIRTRCGNRVSQQPQLPIYEHEPTGAALDTPLAPAPDIETEPFSAIAPKPLLSDAPSLESPLFPLGSGGQAGDTKPMTPYVPFAFFPPAGCVPQNSKTPCGNTSLTPAPPPPAPTPENPPLLLVLTGAAALGIYKLRRQPHSC